MTADKHFKGQLDTEDVECFYRKHWVVLINNFLGFFIFMGILVFVAANFRGMHDFFASDSFFINFLAFSTVTLFTVYIHRFFLRIIRYYLDIVVVTNYRIVSIDKSLYLRDSKDAVDLPKIQDINKNQHGIMKKILKFSDLVITLSSTSTTKTLGFVPNPDYHFRKINQLKREYIRERISGRKITQSSKQAVLLKEPISGLS